MKAYLTRRYQFPASHRLHNAAMSEAENCEVYGKCNNPHGHGHNYALEITVSGAINSDTGMVCNLADLDSFVQEKVLAVFDHANLNTLPAFAQQIPSTENLCREIDRIFRNGFNGRQGFSSAKLDKLRIEETAKNSFEYASGREVRE
jgi:6-pyruvoyltetrahydropterin/6-carboxytetrahydropterin synthase